MVMENNGKSPEAVASVFLLCEVFSLLSSSVFSSFLLVALSYYYLVDIFRAL